MNSVKTNAINFIDNHPRILLLVVSIFVIIILVFYMHTNGYLAKVGFKGKKGNRKNMSTDEELDSLIESIHEKQKRKSSRASN